MSLLLQQPGFLALLPAALVVWLFWRLLRRRRFVSTATLKLIPGALRRPSRVRALPALLFVLALALIAMAASDPVLPFSEAEVQSRGLDVALVLDLSSSMQEPMDNPRTFGNPATAAAARGTKPPTGKTRLEATKQALRDFIGRRRDDRIALIVFSDHAYVVSPPTLDYESLTRYVDQVDDQSLRGEGMTAIGDGIALANHVLTRVGKERRDKVVLVFTDGEYNLGRNPIEVLAESKEARIRVHIVGVDLEAEVLKKPAVKALLDTVRGNGGRYVDASTERELKAASAALDALEKGLLTNKVYVRHAPVFHWFALPAGLLLVLGSALRAIPYFADFT
jgi:Ca-activated chloride channel family protein